METTTDYKKTVEGKLEQIKQCKLDIMLLQRKNEELVKENNQKIAEFNEEIAELEKQLEEDLKQSTQKKIETAIGYVSFNAVTDKWVYQEKELLEWCKQNNMPYYKTEEVTSLKKKELKDDIKNGKLKLGDIGGLVQIITNQEPKFTYKVKGVM